MDASYTPVQHYYKESIQDAISKQRSGKVFFFNNDDQVDCVEGKIVELKELPQKGFFIVMDPDSLIRVDRIITLFGKPSAAYDEYDAYANQCLSCTGGYDPESLP